MEERLRRKPKDEKKYLTELGRRLDEAFGWDGRREIMRKLKGKREGLEVGSVKWRKPSRKWHVAVSSKNGIDTMGQSTRSQHVEQKKKKKKIYIYIYIDQDHKSMR